MKLPYRLLSGIRRHLSQPSILLCFALLSGTGGMATASVLDSKHNLSTSGPGPVKAVSETQVCVFCHTPHGADQTAGAPLWNRATSTATYTPYLSSTTDALQVPGTTGIPGGSSKVCLSCHDGTLAIGVVGNLNGKTTTIAMQGTNSGLMPGGSGADTGDTRNLGVDMSNDHPISFTYDIALSSNDGELRPPPVVSGSNTIVGNRGFGVKPTFPLESSQMQCPTCHDPHLSTSTAPKFLRGLRLQKDQPLGGFYVAASDIMCLACHDKDRSVATWSNSAHANVNVANEAYDNTNVANLGAIARDFPPATPVWQASCLNCHDTHTVQGARRLLREGTDSPTTPKGVGNSAIEETCYQCHSAPGTSILNPTSPPNIVPDIKSDFASTIRMPISAQPETHNIGGNFDDTKTAGKGGIAEPATPSTGAQCDTPGNLCGKDFMEPEALLGKVSAHVTIGGVPFAGTITNRHTECTDCHNPHRTTKNRVFNAVATTPDAAGTHKHITLIGDTIDHSNIASGSLRGSFGVEPKYTGANFGTLGIPSTFDVKRGDPGLSNLSDVTQTYVTREYQVCLKCHSNYAYDTPDLLGYAGGTPQYINGFETYLNTAMEFQAPTGHKGTPASTIDTGAYTTYFANNYRSWHPVIDSTGRTVDVRGNASPNLWRSPWNGSNIDGGGVIINTAIGRDGIPAVVTGAVGNQTMYCSDCHGSYTNPADGVVPIGGEDGKSWGPHGSSENFLLKGPSSTTLPTAAASDTLCFRCHDAAQYADATGSPATVLQSGFSGAGNDAWGVPITNLHQRHAFYTTQGGASSPPTPIVWPQAANGTYRCTMCHTGTAHGWKNKDFLVNLNDIGPEVDRPTNGTVGGALGGEIALFPAANTVLLPSQNVPLGTQVPSSMAPVPTGYTNGPYYQGALLYIAATGFKASGTWTKADCATAGCH